MGSGSRAIEFEEQSALIELVEYWGQTEELTRTEVGIAKVAIEKGVQALSVKQLSVYKSNVEKKINSAYNMSCLAGHSFDLHEVKDFLEEGCSFCQENADSD